MVNEVYVLGGGGHGRVVLNALLASGIKVTGVLDPDLESGSQIFGVSVRGGDEFLDQVDPSCARLLNGLGANPGVAHRKRLFEKMKARGFVFETVRHPFAVIGYECLMGEGTQLMAGTILQNRVQIGDNVVINTCASIDHDCVIGPHAFISPGTVLCGEVIVEDSSFVGAGAVVLPGLRIEANAIVGAGAIVTRVVPEGWIVAGNPAVRIGLNK